MGVLNLPFFPFLNLTGIFVCIGIGADDVFVFIDAWKQSAIIMGKETDLAERMSFVLHRACGSMFIIFDSYFALKREINSLRKLCSCGAMDSALVFESKGCGFESHQLCFFLPATAINHDKPLFFE